MIRSDGLAGLQRRQLPALAELDHRRTGFEKEGNHTATDTAGRPSYQNGHATRINQLLNVVNQTVEMRRLRRARTGQTTPVTSAPEERQADAERSRRQLVAAAFDEFVEKG